MNNEEKILELLGQVVDRLDKVDSRLDKVDSRLDQVDSRLDQVDSRLDQVDSRLDQVDSRLDELENRMDTMNERLNELHERTLYTAAILENEVRPKLQLLYEGQSHLRETLAPLSRVEALEERVSTLEGMVHLLKRAQ